MTPRRSRSEPLDDAFFPRAELRQPFGPAVPICWAAQTPDSQRLYLEDLDTWVTWLVVHYSLDRRQVPECWDEHWELVEELAALHLAWEGAFATTAQADAPLAWHERFAASRSRLCRRRVKTDPLAPGGGFQRVTQHLEVIGVSKWLVEGSLVGSRTGRSGRCSRR